MLLSATQDDATLRNLSFGIQVIDLGDSMDFAPVAGSGSDELTCNIADIPTDGSNLVIKVTIFPLAMLNGTLVKKIFASFLDRFSLFYCIKPMHTLPDYDNINGMRMAMQALNLFRERTGTQQRFKVHLDKKVPHGAASDIIPSQFAAE